MVSYVRYRSGGGKYAGIFRSLKEIVDEGKRYRAEDIFIVKFRIGNQVFWTGLEPATPRFSALCSTS